MSFSFTTWFLCCWVQAHWMTPAPNLTFTLKSCQFISLLLSVLYTRRQPLPVWLLILNLDPIQHYSEHVDDELMWIIEFSWVHVHSSCLWCLHFFFLYCWIGISRFVLVAFNLRNRVLFVWFIPFVDSFFFKIKFEKSIFIHILEDWLRLKILTYKWDLQVVSKNWNKIFFIWKKLI